MARLFISILQASVAVAFTIWAFYRVFQKFDSWQNSHLSSFVLPVGLALLALRIQSSLIGRVFFEARARSLGCGEVKSYPHKDPILGLDLFLSSMRSLKDFTLLDDLTRRFRELADTYYSLSLGRWTLLTNEHENIKAILGTHMDDWPIEGPRLWTVLPVLGEKSVFASNGAVWHDARSTIKPSFVRDQVADLACFDRHISNLIHKIPTNGETVDLQQLFLAMTMDSSTDFMLGYSTNTLIAPSAEARQFTQDYDYALLECSRRGRLGPILFYLPSERLDGSIKRLREFARFYTRKALSEKSEIRERKYVFLDELAKSGRAEEYIVDQILSIIIAGRDTTASAMTATFWYLARHPESVAKIQTEIADLGTKNPTWEQLRDMKYLNMVIKEALRLFPPVSTNSRTANKDTVLPRGGGPDGQSPILVPKGVTCRWSLYSLHRRKDVFGPDADEFRPERWNNLRVGWEYGPFSGGPRVCLGQQFALTQISYAIVRVLQRFKSIEARDDERMKIRVSTSISFANGCLVSMTPA